MSNEKVMSYEEAFSKIEQATGIHNLNALVNNFIMLEERNFNMFRFVNEQSQDIENLESQIAALN